MHDIWRNVDDECLRAVADTGGCVGIIFVPWFLGGTLACGLDRVCAHIEHVVSVVGWDHVAIGSDPAILNQRDAIVRVTATAICGSDLHLMDGFIPTLPTGFRDASDFPNVTAALLERGHDPADVSRALGLSALRVLRDVCG